MENRNLPNEDAELHANVAIRPSRHGEFFRGRTYWATPLGAQVMENEMERYGKMLEGRKRKGGGR